MSVGSPPRKYAPYEPDAVGVPLPCLVRPAIPDDAGAISVLDGERNGVDPASIVERIRAHLLSARDRHHVFVAAIEEATVGFGRVGWITPGPGHRDVPEGWYLVGIVVAPAARRHGVGRALVAARVARVAAEGATDLRYVANSLNLATAALHRPFGFGEASRDFAWPGETFPGGEGILFHARIGGG